MSGNKSAQLICIGNAMVDVFAEVPADFCKRFALALPVQHVDYKTAAAVLDALPSDKVVTSGGGAANTAKIAAHLGIPSAFIGAAGSDPFGILFEEELKRSGVNVLLARKKSPTGFFICITNKTPGKKNPEKDTNDSFRYIVASASAALELDAGDIDEAVFSQGSIPQVLFLEGFILDKEPLVTRVLELVEKFRLTVAIDPGTAEIAARQGNLVKQGTSPFWDKQLRHSNFPLLLFFNETEAEAFAAVLGTHNQPALSDWENLFVKASRDSSDVIAVKQAERGAVVFSGGRVYHVKAEPVQAAESTGAGDAFAAGFIASWLRGMGPEECGLSGNNTAALVLQAPGTLL